LFLTTHPNPSLTQRGALAGDKKIVEGLMSFFLNLIT
jgi:hypothetical protein